MRSEAEMYELILRTAQRDKRVRAVYMNGSRANPNVPKDIFQDYDIVYVVTETATFLEDSGWICVFGKRLMLQEPDRLDEIMGKETCMENSYTYLILFTDGNRIDLRLQTIEAMEEDCHDRLVISLLDKDNILPVFKASTDVDYRVQKPKEGMYISCCNDFWWCMQNVAKGIWRDEIPYAKQMLDGVVREKLDTMVSWWIGSEHDFNVSAGKMMKYFKHYLPENYWEAYKATYSNGEAENIWDAVFAASELFRCAAKQIAERFQFVYIAEDDENMTLYLKRVRMLPRDAKEIL